MMISKNFARFEFACHCNCGADTIDAGLIKVLQEIRDNFNKPVTVTSGVRCMHHNERVGGTPKSQHLNGRAADIIVSGVDPEDVVKWVNTIYPNSLGLGDYSTFTHIDSRNKQARWVG